MNLLQNFRLAVIEYLYRGTVGVARWRSFLPRDAMLAPYKLSSCVHPSARPSVTSREFCATHYSFILLIRPKAAEN